MTAVTDSDLKRLEDLIIGIANGQKALETHMIALDTRMTGIETRMTVLETRMTGIEGEQSKLIEKVDGMDKRLTIIETKLDEWKPSMARITDLAEKVGELKKAGDRRQETGDSEMIPTLVILHLYEKDYNLNL